MKDWQFKELFSQTGLFGEEHPITKNDRAMTLLELMVRKPGPRQMARVFREYTKAAAANRTDQMSLTGPSLDPKQVLTFAIESASKREQAEQAEKAAKKRKGEDQPEMFKSFPAKQPVLRKAGGPFIGPRGGKWADPEMTIPWQEGGQTQPTQQPVTQVPQRRPVAPQAQPAGDLAPQAQQPQPAQPQDKVPQRTPVQMPQAQPAQPAHPPKESEGELYQKLNGKLPAVKSTEEHIAIAKQVLSQHQAAFQQTMGAIQQLAGQGVVSGRVKTLGSALKKLVIKPKYGSVDKLQDVTGMRVMHGSIGEVKETVARLKAQFKVVTEDDYINQPQGNYRSYHLIIQGPTGLEIEVQVRTKNQNTFADWAHNVYKPLTPEQQAHKDAPEVVNYAKTMADYFWDRDNGKQPSVTPNCTPLIQQTFGCMEIA
jgi:ppGpp synthetase/RelA/SpoT-type nucleotidyltranferase